MNNSRPAVLSKNQTPPTNSKTAASIPVNNQSASDPVDPKRKGILWSVLTKPQDSVPSFPLVYAQKSPEADSALQSSADANNSTTSKDFLSYSSDMYYIIVNMLISYLQTMQSLLCRILDLVYRLQTIKTVSYSFIQLNIF